MLYDSDYTKLWKKQNYRHSKKTSGCQGFRKREKECVWNMGLFVGQGDCSDNVIDGGYMSLHMC